MGLLWGEAHFNLGIGEEAIKLQIIFAIIDTYISSSWLNAEPRFRSPETPCRYIIARVNESIYFFYHSRNITQKFIHESTIF